MIRNVVVGVVKPEVGTEQIEAALDALRAMRIDGVDMTLVCGQDLGLRPGNASFVITVDLANEDDYRTYDLDEEHNRIRADYFVPMSETITRIQFELP